MTQRMLSLAIVGIGALLTLSGTVDAAEKYTIANNAIPASLTGKPGDPANGRKIAIDRRKGNCLACHAISAIPEQQFHGNVGPALDGVGAIYSAAELRLRVVNPKTLNPDTMMPSFYRTTGFHRVQKKWEGKSIISAQEVEDVVAFLQTLKKK